MHEAIKSITLSRVLAQTSADSCGEHAPISAELFNTKARELTMVLLPLQWRGGDPDAPGFWWVKTKNLEPTVVRVDAQLWHVYYALGDRQNPFFCAGPIPIPV